MTRKDLLKKHKEYKFYQVTLNYQKEDITDKILNDLKKTIGGTKSSILRNALFSYNLFIKNSLRELNKNENYKNKKNN